VFDSTERHDDELSEVIGRGWEFSQSSTELNKEEILKSETHATKASNIKNSSTIYSFFGTSESHLQK
jgi:hypothetical protein